MRRVLLVLLVPLLLVASGLAARPCDSAGLVGLRFVPFPMPLPTPGGHMASGAYVDDRPAGDIALVGIHTGLPSVNGQLGGDGTWIYLETNGVSGLQRGGHSSLPCTPTDSGGCSDVEFRACAMANPDELVF